jgi:hypothetical protein
MIKITQDTMVVAVVETQSYNANETYTTTEVETPAIGPASWNNDTVTTTVSPKTPQDTYGEKYTGGGFFSGANKYGYMDTIGRFRF